MEKTHKNIYGAEHIDGEFTKIAQNKMSWWTNAYITDDDYDFFRTVVQQEDHQEKHINFILFADGLKNTVRQHGFVSKKNSEIDSEKEAAEIVSFILKSGKQRGIILPRTTIRNWVFGDSSPQNKRKDTTRQNIYQLCFALGLSLEETADFFYYVYLDRPFNTRDITETVYLYCLQHQKSYNEAVRLIETIQPSIQNLGKNHCYGTYQMNLKLQENHNDQDFIAFCEENAAFFSTSSQNQTALQHYKDLLKKTQDIIHQKRNIGRPAEKISGHMILKELCGFDSTIKSNKNAVLKDIMHAATFTNFPNRGDFSYALQGKVSSDVLRKLLILLKFFVFFEDASTNEYKMDIESLFDDFVTETNDMLYSCAFIPLYARNPYDWIFLSCASTKRKNNKNIWLKQFQNVMTFIFAE